MRGGNSSQDDSFGLVSLCSIGPILAVMLIGRFFDASSNQYAAEMAATAASPSELMILFAQGLPHYFQEVALALLPIILFFLIFQVFFLHLPKTQLIKIAVGIAYTFFGLVLFLTGVNVGFMPAGNYLGGQIASLSYHWILIPLGMVIGFFIVMAEPAVHVLNDQVEEITGGAISKRSMLFSLAIGVAISLGFAMIRVVFGVSIWFFLAPCYGLALFLTFLCQRFLLLLLLTLVVLLRDQ